jgi:hypothetical protein
LITFGVWSKKSFRRSPWESSSSAMTRRVLGAFASLLAHERETLSCRAPGE